MVLENIYMILRKMECAAKVPGTSVLINKNCFKHTYVFASKSNFNYLPSLVKKGNPNFNLYRRNTINNKDIYSPE